VLYNGRKILTGEKIPVGSILTLQIGNGDVESDQNTDSTTTTDGSVMLDENTGQPGMMSTEGKATKNEPKTTSAKASSSNNKGNAKNNQTKEKVKTKTKAEKQSEKSQSAKKSTPKKPHKNESNDSWF
jgi:hypothetical protein